MATFGKFTAQYCATPTAIQISDQVLATFSPALQNNSTSESIPISLKAVPAAVIGEPLLSSLSFSQFVGQTVTKSFSVFNYTASPVTVTGVSTGSSVVTNTGGSPVGAVITANGGSRAIQVQALPQSSGFQSGTIQVSTTGGTASYNYSLSSSLISITTSSGANGTISASTQAGFGQNVDITLTAFTGYALDRLTVNGQNVTAALISIGPNQERNYRYSFNATGNASVAATFSIFTPSTSAAVPAIPVVAQWVLGIAIAGFATWTSIRRKRSV